MRKKSLRDVGRRGQGGVAMQNKARKVKAGWDGRDEVYIQLSKGCG